MLATIQKPPTKYVLIFHESVPKYWKNSGGLLVKINIPQPIKANTNEMITLVLFNFIFYLTISLLF